MKIYRNGKEIVLTDEEIMEAHAEHIKSYRDTNNGIAWIEDGSTGLGISVHPNLDKSGSVTGMKKLGYWDKSDRIVLSHGWKYNIDRFVCDKKNDLEMIVADECMCQVCLKRRGA